MPPVNTGALGVRVRKDDFVALVISSLVTGVSLTARAFIEYDDGTSDDLQFPVTALNVGTNGAYSQNRVNKTGTLYGMNVWVQGTQPPTNTVYVQAYLNRGEDIATPNVVTPFWQGYIEAFQESQLWAFEPKTRYATWVFSGSVQEDGTGGTHVCTLTVTPGAGNELMLLGGQITDGNTATAQTVSAFDTDGTNVIVAWIKPVADTAQTSRYFPTLDSITANGATSQNSPATPIISGTMKLILQVSTTAISVTQTFAVICRIRGNALPTATLADTVGTPVLTTNTSAVFG